MATGRPGIEALVEDGAGHKYYVAYRLIVEEKARHDVAKKALEESADSKPAQ